MISGACINYILDRLVRGGVHPPSPLATTA